MNVAFVSTFAVGGAAQGAENTYRAFLAAGHEATFLTLEDGSAKGFIPLADGRPQSPDLEPLRLLFRHWSSLGEPEALARGASELFSDAVTGVFRLGEQARQALYAADVVNIHWHAGVLFSPEFVAALAGKKIVLTLPDIGPITGGCHYHLTCRRFEQACGRCPVFRLPGAGDASRRNHDLKRRLYALLRPGVVTLSRWLADETRASSLLGGRPVANILYTYPLEVFRPLRPDERQAVLRRYGIPSRALVVLAGAYGLGSGRKNIAALVRAMERVRAACPDKVVELVTYGNGPAPQAAFPIRQVGYVDNAAMWELYGAADLFVHPAVAEALGNTLCEAQCCGTPVVSFDVGGCPETYEPGVSGFRVDTVGEDALYAQLLDIVNNPGQLIPMRRAARKFAMAAFSPQKHVRAYAAVMEAAETARPLADDPGLASELAVGLLQSRTIFDAFADARRADRLARLETAVYSMERLLREQEQRLAACEKGAEAIMRMVGKLGAAVAPGTEAQPASSSRPAAAGRSARRQDESS